MIKFREWLEENDDKNIFIKDALKIFNYVIYVTLEISKKYNIKNLKFYGETTELDKLYTNMVKNKFFIEEFKKLGYNFTKINDSYHFDKD